MGGGRGVAAEVNVIMMIARGIATVFNVSS